MAQIGIIVGLLSTSIQSLGLTLQRKSHLLEDDKDETETRRPPYKRRRWQLGMGMFVVSNIVGSTIQITTLPLPVLSTLQASGLVFNTAFATLLLKEPFTRFSLIGTILTCAGAAIIATFGAIGEPAHSLSQLLDLLNKKQFISWMIATLAVAVGTILFAHVLKIYSSHKHFEQHLQKLERSTSGSSHAVNQAQIKRSFTANLPPQLQLKVSRLRLIRGLSYALISGILSAHSLLVAKSAVELLVRTIVDHNNQFNRFQSWLILIALLFFALTQLYYLHLGLRLCSTSVLYPFVFCIYNIIAILDGLIYFRQASRLSALHGGLIALGTVILLSGVLALSWRLDDSTPSDPSASSQTLPPQTPLTPGMGLVHTTTEESERSPLLPTSRPRGSSNVSRTSVNEQTPLLQHGRIRPHHRTSIVPSPTRQDVWAELNDADGESDILASLPRTPSPFLTHRRLRSVSSPKRKRDSVGSEDSQGVYWAHPPPRRRGSGLRIAERRRSSAPSVPAAEDGSASQSPAEADAGPTRLRGSSAQLRASRWDMGVQSWLSGKGKRSGKEGDEDPGG
jgi:magnesium transporter